MLLEAGIACGSGLVIYEIVKKTTRRSRPCHIAPHCWSRMKPPDQYSFPSGHTITAFAVAVSLSLHFPLFAVPLFFLATCVAVSRIFLGMHFLSDVLAGLILGVSLAYAGHAYMVP